MTAEKSSEPRPASSVLAKAASEVARIGHAASVADNIIEAVEVRAGCHAQSHGFRHRRGVDGNQRLMDQLDLIGRARGPGVGAIAAENIKQWFDGIVAVPLAADNEPDFPRLGSETTTVPSTPSCV